MGDTAISWTEKTWNPVRGCSRVSAGCVNCYAEVQAARIVRMGVAGKLTGKTSYHDLVELRGNPPKPHWTGKVVLVLEHLRDPLAWKKPQLVFVNSMSDLFHERLTNQQIAVVYGIMAAAPRHTFQVLTKRARRRREWFAWVVKEAASRSLTPAQLCIGIAAEALLVARESSWSSELYDISRAPGAWPLPHVWEGTSVENQDAADDRIPDLLLTPAAVRFLSCEPLLGEVDLHAIQIPGERDGLRFSALQRHHDDRFGASDTVIDWIIAGCESGPGARPCDVRWLRSLRDQRANAGTAFFLKQAAELITSRGVYPSRHAARVTTEIVTAGPGSRRKAGGIIELPYLDGVQHAAFPESYRSRATNDAPGETH